MKKQTNGFTLVELLVVIAIIGILIGMLLPAVQQVREATRRIECANKMRQMSLAMVNYESAHQNFPPGIRGNGMEQRGLNWCSFILPFIEQQAIHSILSEQSNNFKTPDWVAAGHGDTAEEILPIFHCPSDEMEERNTVRGRTPGGSRQHGKSNYAGVLGPRLKVDFPSVDDFDDISFTQSGPIAQGNVTDADLFVLKLPGILYLNSEVTFGEISDGASNTFVIGERDGSFYAPDQWQIIRQRSAATWCGAVWAQGLSQCLGPTSGDPEFALNSVINTRFARQYPFASLHPGGANFGRADGSVEFVAETISNRLYQEMGTKAGGDVLVNN